MIPIDIKVNADEALRLYTNLINKLSDISPELFLCRQMLLDEFQKNLDNQLNPDGSKYKILSEIYKKSKAYRNKKDYLLKNLVLLLILLYIENLFLLSICQENYL